MTHPFHEIVSSPSECDGLPPRAEVDGAAPSERGRALASAASGRLGRRGFFASVIAGAAGLVAFLVGRSASAWPWRRWPYDRDFDRWYGGRRATTLALGEEGSDYPRPQPGPPRRVTTYALGEEGSGFPPPREQLPPPGPVTTYALGEEGSRPPPPRTTLALGEEG